MDPVSQIVISHNKSSNKTETHMVYLPKVTSPTTIFERGAPRYVLFSFIPAPKLKVDEPLAACRALTTDPKMIDALLILETALNQKKFVGVGVVRGCFKTRRHANRRAASLVEDVAQHATIFTCLVGKPFPIVERGFAESVNKIDLSGQTTAAGRRMYDEHHANEKKNIAKIKQEKEDLCSKVAEGPRTPQDIYTEYRVKLAQIQSGLDAWREKIINGKQSATNCRAKLVAMSQKTPALEKTYIAAYQTVCAKVGVTVDDQFMHYLVTPL